MIPANLKDKVPPHNSEAEQACLGAILLDPDALPIVLRFLRPEDFYVNANKDVFAAMLSLYERAQKADLITLTDEMRGQGTLDRIGGVNYIANLTSVTPSAANVEYYARIVQDTSVRRKVLGLSAILSADAHDDSLASELILDTAQTRIFEITENRQSITYHSVRDLLPQTMKTIEQLYHNKEPFTGIPTGFSDLDSMTSGFQNSEFIVIGARPSVGKTALALTMATHDAVERRIPTAFFSLEMADTAIMQRLISSEAQIPNEKLRTGLIRNSDFNDLMAAAQRIYEAPLYIVDTPNMKLLDLRTLARRVHSERDVKIIYIDYLTLITHENADLPRWEQIASISRSLKALARELRIPVVALSQLKREAEGKQPTLADLRESGSIEQDADVILFLHRERDMDKKRDERPDIVETDLLVAKNRNGPVGKTMIVFHPSFTRFTDPNSADQRQRR